jgi:hypothetical protein
LYAVAGCNQISGVDSLSIESDAEATASGEAGGAAGAGDADAAGSGDGGDRGAAGGDAAGIGDGIAGDGACSISHSNGLGQTFVDCVAADTHDQAQALAACAAYTGNSSLCAVSSLSCGGTGGLGAGTRESPVCSSGSKPCACWLFSGTDSGRVSEPATTCACPTQSSPTWN